MMDDRHKTMVIGRSKTVHQYDSDGYYIGTATAHEINGVMLMPHNTTTIEPFNPSLVTDFYPRWSGMRWDAVENHVGKKGYVDGVYTEIKDYGALPEGWTTEPPAPEVDPVAAEIAELKAYLASTDYIALKLAEYAVNDYSSEALDEYESIAASYADKLQERKEARARINELEG